MSISSVNSNNKRPGEELENPAKFAKTEEKAAFYAKEAEKTQNLAKRIECLKNAVIYDPTNEEYCSGLRKCLISGLKEKITKAPDYWQKLNSAIEIFGLDPQDREFFNNIKTFEPLICSDESFENRRNYAREHTFLCPRGRGYMFYPSKEKISLEEYRRLQYFTGMLPPNFLENYALEELEAASTIEEKVHWALIATLIKPENFYKIALPKLKEFYFKEHEEKRLDQEGLEKELIEWLQVLPSNVAQKELNALNADLETKYLKPIQHFFRNETQTSKRSKILFAKGLETDDFLTLCKGALSLMPDWTHFIKLLGSNSRDIIDSFFSIYEKEPLETTELQLTALSGIGTQEQRNAIHDRVRNALQKRLEDLAKNGSIQEQLKALLDLCLLGTRRTDDIAPKFLSLANEAKSDQEKCLNLFYASYSPECYERYSELFKHCLQANALKKETSSDVLYAHLVYPNEITMQKLLSLREGFEAMQEIYFTRWDKIDPALFHYLCSFLDIKDICRLMGVSQLFKNIISSKSFENSWQIAFMDTFAKEKPQNVQQIRKMAPDDSTWEKSCRSLKDMNYRFLNDIPVLKNENSLPGRLYSLNNTPYLLNNPPLFIDYSKSISSIILKNPDSGVVSNILLTEFLKEGSTIKDLGCKSWKNQTALIQFSTIFASPNRHYSVWPADQKWILCYNINGNCLLTKKNVNLDSPIWVLDDTLLITKTPEKGDLNLELYDPITGNSEHFPVLKLGKKAQNSDFCANQDWICFVSKNSQSKKNRIIIINRKTKKTINSDHDYTITLQPSFKNGQLFVSTWDFRTRTNQEIIYSLNKDAKEASGFVLEKKVADFSFLPVRNTGAQLTPDQKRWKDEHSSLYPQILGPHVLTHRTINLPYPGFTSMQSCTIYSYSLFSAFKNTHLEIKD